VSQYERFGSVFEERGVELASDLVDPLIIDEAHFNSAQFRQIIVLEDAFVGSYKLLGLKPTFV
jgi:hypothetical protein